MTVIREPSAVHQMVELVSLDSTLRVDVRYATAANFVERQVYPEPAVFLVEPAAHSLVRAHQRLKAEGYGLLLFDGYRPWSVTQIFWELLEGPRRAFVADPAKGSVHNRGCAIDLSLFSLATGQEVPMGSEFDETTERAYFAWEGVTGEQRAHRDLLRREMEAQGFEGIKREWWHFNFGDWERYPLYDLSFAQLRRE